MSNCPMPLTDRFAQLIAPVVLGVLLLPMVATAAGERLLIYGGSGRLGGPIVEEALLRGYEVTGVSRDPERLAAFEGRIEIVSGDILDRSSLGKLASEHDAVIVSVGGRPSDPDPAQYIAALAADSLVEALSSLGPAGPRLIFVGNLFTLKFEDDKTLLELGRVAEDHRNHAMFHGHQLALDRFRESRGVTWTVASPPNGLRLKGRTGEVRWGGDILLRDADGTPSGISREDFAFAVLEELERERYLNARFNVAR
ncbi:MAG: NAD(P)H-binding protein [Pseudomonadota bacterium]